MDAAEKRIDRAWQNTRDWITDFDGSPTETYLTGIAADTLPQAIETLARQSENFRLSTISGQEADLSQPVGLETFPDNLARLIKGEIAGLNANYAARLQGFDLDIHLVVHVAGERQVDLEIIWWGDQAFPDDTDHAQRFRSIIDYFIGLQSLFKASKLYIGPESWDKPGTGESWIEV